MIKFFTTTKYIWLSSRVFLIILFSYVFLSRISDASTSDLVANSFTVFLVFLMVIITVRELLKKQTHYLIRFIVGICIAVYGVMMSYLVLTSSIKEGFTPILIMFQLVPIWVILCGTYEIVCGINSIKKHRR